MGADSPCGNPHLKNLLASLSLSLLALSAAASGSAQDTPRPADVTYQQYRANCHTSGWNGAPIAGINSDWEPLLATGFDTMLANARQGLNTMPPMGTRMDCTDARRRIEV